MNRSKVFFWELFLLIFRLLNFVISPFVAKTFRESFRAEIVFWEFLLLIARSGIINKSSNIYVSPCLNQITRKMVIFFRRLEKLFFCFSARSFVESFSHFKLKKIQRYSPQGFSNFLIPLDEKKSHWWRVSFLHFFSQLHFCCSAWNVIFGLGKRYFQVNQVVNKSWSFGKQMILNQVFPATH